MNEFDKRKSDNGVEILDESKEDTFDIEKYEESDEIGKVIVSTLFFLPVSIDANYTCQAQNDFGRSTKRIEVKTGLSNHFPGILISFGMNSEYTLQTQRKC